MLMDVGALANRRRAPAGEWIGGSILGSLSVGDRGGGDRADDRARRRVVDVVLLAPFGRAPLSTDEQAVRDGCQQFFLARPSHVSSSSFDTFASIVAIPSARADGRDVHHPYPASTAGRHDARGHRGVLYWRPSGGPRAGARKRGTQPALRSADR